MAKYVIMEVKDGFKDDEGGLKQLRPTVGYVMGEFMFLDPDRIREGTWRYGIPGEGDNILIVSGVGTLMMYNVCSNTIKDYRIILDPPAPEPMPEWEQEVRDILTPVISLERVDRLIGALRKMKEGEDG